MATTYIKKMTDDMAEGEEADLTMEFSYNGVAYEIDLAMKRYTKYDAMFQELISHGRRVGGKKTTHKTSTVKRGSSGMSSEQLSAVRRWARENGYPNLSDRGRVSGEILAAFEAAGGLRLVPEFQAPEFSAT